jgi:hypothetical protein
MLICMRTTLNLDDGLVREAKARAVAEGGTLTSVIEAALRAAFRAGDDRPPRRRIELPLIDGRLQPGIDLDDHEAMKDVLVADEEALYRSQERRAGP